jgi:hypothetical protein
MIMIRIVLASLLLITSAHAYTVNPGDLLLRAVVGPSVNVMRLDVATKATPPAGLLVGVDFDYSFDGAWALTSSLRTTFSPGYLDGNLGVGAKYRVLQLNAPFIPYASAMAVAAIGGPLGYGDVHLNIGVRAAGGVDYFVRKNLSVGLELAAEGTVLLLPIAQPESSVEGLVTVGWRL